MLPLQRQMTAVLSNVGLGKADIGDYILMWNVIFPVDRWWRLKHSVPYGSSAHKDSSFDNMLAEYKEDELYDDLNNKEAYVAGSGDIFKSAGREKKEEQEYDDLFDKIKV